MGAMTNVPLTMAAGLTTDPLEAAAEVLHPGATIVLALASGDLVYARLANANVAIAITGRVTVRV